MDDFAVREAQRQDVSYLVPGGLDLQQRRGSPGRQLPAVRPDDQEFTIACYPVLPELDLAGALQPHALDRSDC
jgi:hypothetical protein